MPDTKGNSFFPFYFSTLTSRDSESGGEVGQYSCCEAHAVGIMRLLSPVEPMARRLALFDLDNTLLAGDSDHAWGEFLIRKQLVEESTHRARNDEFYRDYLEGELDIHAYVKFTLSPILKFSQEQLNLLHTEFMREAIRPMILVKGMELVERHRSAGDYCVIITATNDFITAPIAAEFRVDQLLATELELLGARYTGIISGIPCYRAGKVEKLERWLAENDSLQLNNSIFYSDSINDLPLLEKVTEAVAVDPDERLVIEARERGWQTLSLRG